MNKTLTYPAKAVFPSREALFEFIEGKNLVQGKYLIAGSAGGNNSYNAFYNPKSHQVELKLKGRNIDEIINAAAGFFEIVDNCRRKIY